MRAVVVNETGNRDSIEVRELDTPRPQPDQVVVDVHAASINFPDVLQIDGKYQIKPPEPFTPGKDAAGVVSAVGDNVSNISAGDNVLLQVTYGAFAEQVAVDAASVYVMPPGIDFPSAAAMGLVYQTAHVALLERGRLKAGDTVLVTGASGGVGLAAVQLAKAYGATVLAGLTTPGKSAAILDAGADHVIDLSGDPTSKAFKDGIRDQVHALTDRRGVDIVVDVVGGDVFDACLRTLSFCGRILILGFTSGSIPAIKSNYLLLKNISAIGMSINAYMEHSPAIVREVQDELFALFENGKINPVISHTFGIDEFASAFEVIETRKTLGKVVLSIRQDQ